MHRFRRESPVVSLLATSALVALTMCSSSSSPTDGSGGGSYSGTGGGGDYPPLDPDRATTWGFAGMLTKSGVPSASWPICNSTALAPSGGDDAKQINDAIAQCAEGTVVKLGPGTFVMGQGSYVAIDKGVVVRGSGAGVTILKNPRNVAATQGNTSAADATPIVIVGPSRYANPDGDGRCAAPTPFQPQFMQLLSADGKKGSTSVTVVDGSIFSTGQMVLLDEASGAGWQPDVAGLSTSVWASPDYAVSWQVHKPAFGGDDPVQTDVQPSTANNYAGSGNGSDGACWFARQDRPQNEIKEVASVSGNTVTFTSPLHKSYRTGQHAELTTYTGNNTLLQSAGVEQLTAVGGGDGAVRFENAAYSWAKNIEVTV
ncbi:MAG TPA: hypothetical protein VIF15_13520, partial [Polyangiaceae bacterium]